MVDEEGVVWMCQGVLALAAEEEVQGRGRGGVCVERKGEVIWIWRRFGRTDRAMSRGGGRGKNCEARRKRESNLTNLRLSELWEKLNHGHF